ncbi:hypothetical protein ACJX0J_014397 [Zea mays]
MNSSSCAIQKSIVILTLVALPLIVDSPLQFLLLIPLQGFPSLVKDMIQQVTSLKQPAPVGSGILHQILKMMCHLVKTYARHELTTAATSIQFSISVQQLYHGDIQYSFI